jgi:hypothetical protein
MADFHQNLVTSNMQTYQNNLIRRINEAARANKVLDVSRINGEGKGARIIPRPRRGSKLSVPELNSVMSDNYGSYLLTMTILGDNYLHLAAEFQDLQDELDRTNIDHY